MRPEKQIFILHLTERHILNANKSCTINALQHDIFIRFHLRPILGCDVRVLGFLENIASSSHTSMLVVGASDKGNAFHLGVRV